MVQTVSRASVTVGGEVVGTITDGLLVLVGVTHSDGPSQVDTLARKVLSSLKTVINIAMERGKVAQNVATTLRRTRAKRRRVGAVNGDPFCGRVEIPTPMEMQSMLAVTSEHYPAFYPMLCMAAFTGMRI